MAVDKYILDLRKDFFEEAFEMLERLENNIMLLSKSYDDKDAIQEIFRAVHTLKGSAGAVELMDVQRYAHCFEDLLDFIRNGKIDVDDENIDMLLRGIDNIKELILSANDNRQTAINVEKELEIIDNFREKKIASLLASSVKKSGETSEEYLFDIDSNLIEFIRNAKLEGSDAYVVKVQFNEESVMKTVGGIQIFVNLKDIGDIIASVPTLSELENDVFYPVVSYLVTSERNAKGIKEYITISDVTKKITISKFDVEEYENKKISQIVVQNISNNEVKEENIEPKTEDAEKKCSQVKERQSSYLRVESDRIDEMLNQVGELVINKSVYQQYEDDFIAYSNNLSVWVYDLRKYFRETVIDLLKHFENIAEKQELKNMRNEIFEDFNRYIKDITKNSSMLRLTIDKYRSSYQLLSRVTSELQETVMKIRMVPIAQTFNRFSRLIRDLSRDLGKEVELEIVGEETELDKSVIEVLVDPLVHLIRNAMDHGLETTEERLKLKKPAAGKIRLIASHEGNLIIIKITDDGKGIDPQKIFESAVRKSLVSADAHLTEKEMVDLIFLPGFSTADKVTNVSGRGVGMDVVKKSLEKINGTISVDTEKGKGSTFSLNIPLTLAIIQALIVEAEKEYYAIPINSISETLRVENKDIYELEGLQVINIRNEILGVIKLKDIFNLPNKYETDAEYAVVISFENTKIALLVNVLIGEQDIVIKAVNDKFSKSDGISGATLLGDGTVGFILDVQTIVTLGSVKTARAHLKKNVTGRKSDLKSFIEMLKPSDSEKS